MLVFARLFVLVYNISRRRHTVRMPVGVFTFFVIFQLCLFALRAHSTLSYDFKG